IDKPSDFLLAQHRGQAPSLLGIGRLRYTPGSLQGLNEKETQGGQPLGNAARSQLSLAEQIGLVLADVFGTPLVWRAMEITGEILHRRNVTLDGPGSEISTLEFFEHHLA